MHQLIQKNYHRPSCSFDRNQMNAVNILLPSTTKLLIKLQLGSKLWMAGLGYGDLGGIHAHPGSSAQWIFPLKKEHTSKSRCFNLFDIDCFKIKTKTEEYWLSLFIHFQREQCHVSYAIHSAMLSTMQGNFRRSWAIPTEVRSKHNRFKHVWVARSNEVLTVVQV